MRNRIASIILAVALVMALTFMLCACGGEHPNGFDPSNGNVDLNPNDGGSGNNGADSDNNGGDNNGGSTVQQLDAENSYRSFNIAWTSFDVAKDFRIKSVSNEAYTGSMTMTVASEIDLAFHNDTNNRVVDYIKDYNSSNDVSVYKHLQLFRNYSNAPILLIETVTNGAQRGMYFDMNESGYSRSVMSINTAKSIMYALIGRIPDEFNTESCWSGTREVATDKIELEYKNPQFTNRYEGEVYYTNLTMNVTIEKEKITSVKIVETTDTSNKEVNLTFAYDIDPYVPYDYETFPYGGSKDWFDFSSL